MPDWINYKDLKQALHFPDVLAHYQVTYKAQGEQAHARCPLPGHEQSIGTSGRKSKPSFSAHLGRGVWKCFGCDQSGNILEFIALMEGLDPGVREQFRKAARLAQERFLNEAPPVEEKPRKQVRKRVAKPSATVKVQDKKPAKKVKAEQQPVLVNPPLDFTLKELDPEHPYLRERGLEPRTIEHFGLGYCVRGRLKGRIAIPLHDHEGQLVGYAGRLVKDKDISEARPKYLYPSTREREGVVHEFRVERLLYHDQRMKRGMDELIVVQGFPNVWRLWQLGHTYVVGLLTSSCSSEQVRQILLLLRRGGILSVCTGNTKAGMETASGVFQAMGHYRPCRWLRDEESCSLADVPDEDLNRLLAGWSEH